MFNPKRPDGRPEWKVVFDLVEARKPGATITFAELEAALETVERHRVHRAVAQCNKHLWVERFRSLGSTRGVGYTILLPLQHEDLALGHHKKSKRSMGKAVLVAKATDMTGLTISEQQRMRALAHGLNMMAMALQHHAIKLAEHDATLHDLARRVDDLEKK